MQTMKIAKPTHSGAGKIIITSIIVNILNFFKFIVIA